MKKFGKFILRLIDPFWDDFESPPEMSQKPCDCGEGGLCPVKHYVSFQGKIWNEDLFECKRVQKQIIELNEAVSKRI